MFTLRLGSGEGVGDHDAAVTFSAGGQKQKPDSPRIQAEAQVCFCTAENPKSMPESTALSF